MLSIIIPTLNAASTLAATLASVGSGAGERSCEIVVVDGGSTDTTPTVARAGGARVVEAPRGRGRQLAAGATASGGDWLLFLHADTRLDAGWPRTVTAFIAEPDNLDRAGYFRFALDDGARAARWLERAVLWRNRTLGLAYGDQGLLIGRAFYDALGGYRDLPLMEDVDLARRIGRRRLVMLGAAATTSADRYRREGYVLRPLRNLLCLALYTVGVPTRIVAALYR